MAFPTSPGTEVQHPTDNASSPSLNDANHLTWTPAHEARLAHVQVQLSAAQAKWSEEQELYLEEVLGLEELRRAHKKAAKKKAKRSAKKTTRIWKAKRNVSPGSAGASEEEGDDDEEETKEMDGSQEIRRPSLGLSMRRMSATRSRRSTFTEECESSNASRRASVIERVQSVGFGGLLRRWSSRGGKGAESPQES